MHKLLPITLLATLSCTGSVGSNDTGGGTAGNAGASATSGTSGSSGGGGTAGSGGTGAIGGSAGTGGAGGGSGDAGAGGGAGTAGSGGASGGSGGGAPASLLDRVSKTTVTVAAGVKDGVQNWSIWGRRDLNVAPVFTVPLSSCQTLVCYTSGSADSPVAHVLRLDALDQLDSTLVDEQGVECRGLAAAPDGQFAALLWDNETDSIMVRRYGAAGDAIGTTPLVNADNHPTDFGIGESRLEYGDGRYGAYYHVHSTSGHEGDTLKWVDAATGAESTAWDWGCSHSMSNLLRFNPALGEFMPACVTDCYPGTSGDFATQSIGGIYLNHDDEKVMDVAAGCNGDVAGELGGAALAANGWKLIFNAHQAPVQLGQDSYDESAMNQDIGFSSVTGTYDAGTVVWLTSTPGVDEMDSSIARFDLADSGEQYLAGWVEDGDTRGYKLARLDASGAFVEGPIDVGGVVQWGRRDDPFRRRQDGDVVWAWFDQAGSTALNVARVDSGTAAACP